MTRRILFLIACVALSVSLGVSALGRAHAEAPFIIVQSTTSTENSGLFAYLLPQFTKATGIEVRVVAVGTGQAIKNAQNGDGDVLLVHAKADEEKFVADGFGVKRHDVMFNDFIVIGAASDPAQIAGGKDTVAAFKKIADAKAPFISRGDDSGTHKAELKFWKDTGVDVKAASGTWYREAGQGMGATITMATSTGAYTLSDRATWSAFKSRGAHKIVVEGDVRLRNPYGVILVNPAKHPTVKAAEGQKFIDWVVSDAGQAAIASFQINGEQQFFTTAKP